MTKCQHVLKFWKYTKCCMILSQSFNFILTPLKPFLPPFPSVWVPLSWEAVVRQVVSNSLQPHELQHVRLPCPSLYPRVCSNSCPLSQWCQLAISSSVASFFSSVQFSSVAQLGNPMSCRTPGLPVQHQLPEPTQTHVHWVSDAIQPSHPLSFPSPPALSLTQHQGPSNEPALHIR